MLTNAAICARLIYADVQVISFGISRLCAATKTTKSPRKPQKKGSKCQHPISTLARMKLAAPSGRTDFRGGRISSCV
jgi:hypothetical protein